jgi:hypothetical protein
VTTPSMDLSDDELTVLPAEVVAELSEGVRGPQVSPDSDQSAGAYSGNAVLFYGGSEGECRPPNFLTRRDCKKGPSK